MTKTKRRSIRKNMENNFLTISQIWNNYYNFFFLNHPNLFISSICAGENLVHFFRA